MKITTTVKVEGIVTLDDLREAVASLSALGGEGHIQTASTIPTTASGGAKVIPGGQLSVRYDGLAVVIPDETSTGHDHDGTGNDDVHRHADT